MKNIALTIALTFATSAAIVPQMVLASSTANTSVSNAQYTDAELDSLLAPIALYPDTLLTHILIASTYPLDVIAADRWRQSNTHLSAEQVEHVIAPIDWDPSVKALVPFTDILNTMAQDIEWMEQLGDNMLVNEERVLARVQDLRGHAMNAGNLTTNEYLSVEREKEIIYIAPRHRETVYVPYYNPTIVYGTWHHSIAPRHWHHGVSFHQRGGFYWSPQVHISALFYFGGIHWHNRYVVTHRQPVKTYYRGAPAKRVYSKGYQRWQHNVQHRRARYSPRIVHSTPKSFQHKRVVHTKPRASATRHVNVNGKKAPKLARKVAYRGEPSGKKHARVERALKSRPGAREHRPNTNVRPSKASVNKRVVGTHPVKPQPLRTAKAQDTKRQYTQKPRTPSQGAHRSAKTPRVETPKSHSFGNRNGRSKPQRYTTGGERRVKTQVKSQRVQRHGNRGQLSHKG